MTAFGTQGGSGSGTSYRIGDHARAAGSPDGDHVAHVVGFDWAQTRDGKPQLKVTSKLLDVGGRQHTWYYTLTEDALWRLFQDLLAAGADPDFNPGPPGPQYMDMMRPGFLDKHFQIRIATKGEYQNTTILGPAQPPGPGGVLTTGPASFPGTQHTLEGADQHDNKTEAVHPAGSGSPWGSTGLPMQTGTPRPTAFAPSTQPPTDAAKLFGQG
jgi:hypothetical protein